MTKSTSEERDLSGLESSLGYQFSDRALLQNALTHSSHAYETEGIESNERLEFLGDAVIALVVGHLLYEANPSWEEGDLTRALHRLVDRLAFASLARQVDLGLYLSLGRTEQQSDGNAKDSILANSMEAIVGALYLDGGIEAVRGLVVRFFGEAVRSGAPRVERDPKTRFQEAVMALHGEFPRYELERDSLLEGDELRFTTRVLVLDECWGTGTGRTKRAAEFAAAQVALARLDTEPSADV